MKKFKINKSNMDHITRALKEHKANIDGNVKFFTAENKAFNDEIEGMKGKYTEEYIEETRRNHTPKIDYKAAMIKSQKTATAAVKKYADIIREEIEAFYNAPVSPEFANKVNAIAITGMPLTDREFDMLARSCSSYMEARILAHMAESREKETTINKVNIAGEVEAQKTTTPTPYYLPDMVSLDECEKALETYINHANDFIQGYCGENAELYDYRTCNNTSLSYDRAVASTHANFLQNAYDADFTSIIDRMNKLAHSNVEPEPLTADEIGIIDGLIDPKYKYMAPGEVKRLSAENEMIRDMLMRDERYKQYVPDPADFELPLS